MSLIEFINHWIKSVAMIFIVISIIEILIPNSSLKRYINMFIGFLIIIVIITPFVKLLDSNYDIEREIFKNYIDGIEVQKVSKEDILLAQEEQIKELYINKLKADVLETIKEITDYDISTVDISIYEDKDNYGNIKDIKIALRDKRDENIEEDKSIKVVNIGEISINKIEEAQEYVEADEKEKIIDYLCYKYNVSKDNIRVFINTMREGEHCGKSN